ncbi:uncharacterized protein LOC121386098 [Gigantopelta aegis]|uniref:uncharacterized protein LOC121386098 n=1 Tax=Gigantopelta aegis TaxID=1735272 RepID=UPI001B88DA84|nr:uncharacterized protein LOC121386098 [Gigantopelta aegis]
MVFDPLSVTSFTINSRSDSVTTVTEGAPVSLTCDVRSDPVSSVQLTKGSQKLCDPRQSGAECNWTAGCLDSREYTCTADNGIQPSVSRTLNMVVRCSPRLDYQYVSQARTLLAHVNDNVTLRVFTIANPRPKFKWTKLHNNVEHRLASSAPTTSTTSTAVGEYTLVNVNDSGTYKVYVHNGVGSALVVNFTVSVMEQGSPRLDYQYVSQARTLLAHVNDNVTLRVFTIANPRPKFKWTKLHNNVEHRLASSAPTTSTTSTAVGEYTLVNVNDSGTYKVSVHNGVGSALVVNFTVSVMEQDTNIEEKQTPLDYDGVAIFESSTMYWVIPSTFAFVICAAIVVVMYRRLRNNKEINTDQSNSGHEYSEPYEMDSLHRPAPAVGISQPAHVYDHLGSRQRSDYRSLDRLTRVGNQTDGEDTNPTRMPISCGDTRRKPSYRALVHGQDASRRSWKSSWLPNVAEYERNSVQVPFLEENVGWNTRNPSWVLFREEDVRPMPWNPARM